MDPTYAHYSGGNYPLRAGKDQELGMKFGGSNIGHDAAPVMKPLVRSNGHDIAVLVPNIIRPSNVGHDVALRSKNNIMQLLNHQVPQYLDQRSSNDIEYSTHMDLSGQSLVSLPTSFLSRNPNLATNLVSLDLSKNQLKSLPYSIGDLESLEILDLQSNELSSLPDSIGFLLNLRVLNVSGNMLSTLPNSIGGCRGLIELNAGFNQLQCLPTQLGFDLINVQNLCLHSNKLTFLPSSICELKKLKSLDLHFNNLMCLPISIGNLSSLQKLNISNNFSDFGGSLPSTIGDLTSLVELDMSFNQVKLLPACVGALQNLKVLKVDNNPLVIPPLEVVDHSMEALLEYMSNKWKTSRTLTKNNDEEFMELGGIRTHKRGSLYKVYSASPLLTSQCNNINMKMIKNRESTPIRRIWSRSLSTRITNWLGGIVCISKRKSSLRHKPLNSSSAYSTYYRYY